MKPVSNYRKSILTLILMLLLWLAFLILEPLFSRLRKSTDFSSNFLKNGIIFVSVYPLITNSILKVRITILIVSSGTYCNLCWILSKRSQAKLFTHSNPKWFLERLIEIFYAKAVQDIRIVVHNFEWLKIITFCQLIFRLTPLTSAAKTISCSVFSSQILQYTEIIIVVHWKFWRRYWPLFHLFSCTVM